MLFTVCQFLKLLCFPLFRYQIQNKQKNGVMDKIKDIYSKYCTWYIGRNSESKGGEKYNSRRKWQQLLNENRDGASIVSLVSVYLYQCVYTFTADFSEKIFNILGY